VQSKKVQISLTAEAKAAMATVLTAEAKAAMATVKKTRPTA